ncbi:MAG: hypothetical protein SPH68_03535 [Candidatus Borkfalkiaceae bacterium]|nr:hypothetical protein [Clostridia bacterium]MDY6223218.1 hypothetical protein [Christensenellaceae bacterium]
MKYVNSKSKTTTMTTKAENQEETGTEKGKEKGKRDYIKTALYVYPALKAAAKEVSEHVQRKACLSYGDRRSCEALAEYLLQQLDTKERLETLFYTIGNALDKLSAREKFLLQVRYFGGKHKVISAYSDEELQKLCGSRRSYYRRQEKLVKKIGERFMAGGLNEENFYREYGSIELIRRVDNALASGRRGAQGAREEQVLARLS